MKKYLPKLLKHIPTLKQGKNYEGFSEKSETCEACCIS